jgi:hypothetical protein
VDNQKEPLMAIGQPAFHRRVASSARAQAPALSTTIVYFAQ